MDIVKEDRPSFSVPLRENKNVTHGVSFHIKGGIETRRATRGTNQSRDAEMVRNICGHT
jgi:hypothetical protein